MLFCDELIADSRNTVCKEIQLSVTLQYRYYRKKQRKPKALASIPHHNIDMREENKDDDVYNMISLIVSSNFTFDTDSSLKLSKRKVLKVPFVPI